MALTTGCDDGRQATAQPSTTLSLEAARGAYASIVNPTYEAANATNHEYFDSGTLAWEDAPRYCAEFAAGTQDLLDQFAAVAWPATVADEVAQYVAVNDEGIRSFEKCAAAPATAEAQAPFAQEREELRVRATEASEALRRVLGITTPTHGDD